MSLSPSILFSVLRGKMTLLFEIIDLAVFLIQLGFLPSPLNSINYSISFPYFSSLRIPFPFLTVTFWNAEKQPSENTSQLHNCLPKK